MNKWERASTTTGFFSAGAKSQAYTTEQNNNDFRATTIARPLARSIMKAIGTAVNATPAVILDAHKTKTVDQIASGEHLKGVIMKKLQVEAPSYRSGPGAGA